MGIKKGDIVYAKIRNSVGSEQKGIVPAVIVQNDKGNEKSPTTVIAVIGKSRKKMYPMHYFFKNEEAGIRKNSSVLCEQLLTIDKRRIIEKKGRLSEKTIRLIDEKLKIELGL
jgi:mRNA interferase MazF